ncbi:MAG: GTPase Era [Actinomycetota bacterium]|nr:GTPase Era [Actinomycetota bacterium]
MSAAGVGADHRSGFATLVGRPNVGKSTLLNTVVGQKVSITSPVVQTTRNQVRGVLNRPDAQVIFVDTPGIHKPRTLLGKRLNDTASSALGQVDVTVLVIDATAAVGRGDRFVAAMVPSTAICVINKIDRASPTTVLAQLVAASELKVGEYFPVSARTGEGVDVLVDAIVSRLPPGPQFYPPDTVTDVAEAFWVAELVREQLLAVMTQEVPHSIACRVTEWEWPRIRCEINVERDSQKGIVIGRGGAVLKDVGIRVREQLPPGAYLELFVKVNRDWQRHAQALERLGY